MILVSGNSFIFNGVSGTSAGGYSVATVAWPINSTACGTYPTHCYSIASSQVLYKPIALAVALSAQEFANRLEVSWQQPMADVYGFVTMTDPNHTPDMASAYRIEWSTQSSFVNSMYYNLRTIEDDNSDVTCRTRCSYTIGEEVQNVIWVSGNSFMLDGGTWYLLYTGKQTQNMYVLVRSGSKDVIMFRPSECSAQRFYQARRSRLHDRRCVVPVESRYLAEYACRL